MRQQTVYILSSMELQPYDVLILSDLHLGSKTSKPCDALQVLKNLQFHRLILLGDIFSDLNFARLNKEHWRFLSYIRKLSNPKRDIDVVWIEGNHDYGLTDVMSHLVGIPVYQEYFWVANGVGHLAIHGHQFDRLIFKNKLFINRLIVSLHLSVQKLEPKGLYLSRMLDNLAGARWQRQTSRVAQKALIYAKSRGAVRVFCGHTHEPTIQIDNKMEYYNAGSWTCNRPTYITVRGQEIKIHEYTERIDNCHPGKKRRNLTAPAVGFA